MQLVLRHNLLPKARSQMNNAPHLIVLHDTVTPTIKSAENALLDRGLGYHYMIDKDGTCYEYSVPSVTMNHAAGYNRNSVGVSYVCGGQFGSVNDVQIAASIELINYIKKLAPTIRVITEHKHASSSGKIDPQWAEETPHADEYYMKMISEKTNLEFFKFN